MNLLALFNGSGMCSSF